MHWVDSESEKALKRKGEKHVVASGISPSGPIHYGNFREICTADLLHKGLMDAGASSKLIWVSDDLDPLRKVYPFLPSDFEKHVGKPLANIPDPEGCHESYSKHFEEPFLETLPKLGINPEIKRASNLYRKGAYDEAIKRSIKFKEEMAQIIEKVTGRELEEDWIPFKPLCGSCGRYAEPAGDRYICECGNRGSLKNASGKLPWRIDWPARWKIMNVTVEPFGKDHAASGGSYDTGKLISKKIFNYDPPLPVVYEQIGLKSEGEMSSSAGITITPRELLKLMEPMLLRFIISSTKPKKHIELDLEGGLPPLFDELDQAEEKYMEDSDVELARAYDLARIDDPEPIDLPFTHAVNAVQIDPEKPVNVLKRSSHSFKGFRVEKRLENAKNWLERYAPDRFKFNVKKGIPGVDLSEKQQKLLKHIARILEEDELTADQVQSVIFEKSKEIDLPPRQAFSAIYKTILGRSNGPRAGPFLISLEKDFVIERIKKLT